MLPNMALNIVLDAVPVAGRETVSLYEARNRVLAGKIVANRDIPILDSSAMDGYALNSSDLGSFPVKLKVLGVIAAGSDVSGLKTGKGECYRIMTGAYIPQGADMVIEWELTDNGSDYVTVNSFSAMGTNVRPARDDMVNGTELDYTGRRVSPYLMSRIASVGVYFVDVYRKPHVAVLSTGSEIAPPGGYTATDKMFDANSPAIMSMLGGEEAECSYLGVVDDDEDALLRALKSADNFDMIVITGGISTGDFDYMAKIADRAGIRWLFHKVEQKPGKPVAFGFMDGTPIFSLPGNPVSCMFCTYYYVVPAVRRMLGVKDPERKYITAILGSDVSRKKGRVQFYRVKLTLDEGIFTAYPYRSQNSNLIGSMAECDAFMELESFEGTVKKGSPVRVYIFNEDII